MDKREALSAIEMGHLVECTKEDYKNEIRAAIQDQAGNWIDSGDHVRGIIALQEVKRLDKIFMAD